MNLTQKKEQEQRLRLLFYRTEMIVVPAWERVFQQRLNFAHLPDHTKWALSVLLVWSQRYKISVWEILDILHSRYKKFWKTPKDGFSLGISAPTLVGNRSQEILEEEILRLYPNGENVRCWASQRQIQLLGGYPRLVATDDIFSYSRRYEHMIRQWRRQRTPRPSFTRRRYRDNPWAP